MGRSEVAWVCLAHGKVRVRAPDGELGHRSRGSLEGEEVLTQAREELVESRLGRPMKRGGMRRKVRSEEGQEVKQQGRYWEKANEGEHKKAERTKKEGRKGEKNENTGTVNNDAKQQQQQRQQKARAASTQH